MQAVWRIFMKTLGLDIGTNSIGWGIVDEKAEKPIIDCGVYLFPEGVKIEKGVESSKAAERTGFRSARRLKFRRKLRKYETLKVLIQNGMCPLSLEELEVWRKEKIYPSSEVFVRWYRTSEAEQYEPYFLRKKCAEQKCTKHEIGRALYHIAQRRGFLSNRKEAGKETEDGKVASAISELSKVMGEKTLGQYFYELRKTGDRIRGRYTARKEHYEKEFYTICGVQGLSEDLIKQLYRAIFYQRKLKSQKFLVGTCTFEPNKPRCPVSHFEFEEFRMLQFINSIKVAKNIDEDDRQDFVPLAQIEKQIIIPLFYRVSKTNFKFIDIEKKLRGKNKNESWKFNYRSDSNVAGCPVSAGLLHIFGENWKEIKIDNYDSYAIWHVLFDFDDRDKLREFAQTKLHLDEEKVKSFLNIPIHQGYANLSLKAIKKILPFLREGMLYSHAVFMANIPTIIGQKAFEADKTKIIAGFENIIKAMPEKNREIALVNSCIDRIFKDKTRDFRSEQWNRAILEEQIADMYGKKYWEKKPQAEQQEIRRNAAEKIDDALRIAITNRANDYKYPLLRTDDLLKEYLREQGYTLHEKKELYHPSDIEYGFETPKKAEDGKIYLASPRTKSVKNPVAMRALFQLRKLINRLIKTGAIDSSTKVAVELANEVNDKNMRAAIARLQKENETKNAKYKQAIIETAAEHGFTIEPTDKDIKKYRLWKEQKEECPYTGKKISFTDLFGSMPQFDFEHTVPRSLSFDDSLENLTLCDVHFNRSVKKQQLPSQLAGKEDIIKRIKGYYGEKIDQCRAAIERNKPRGAYIEPSRKDAMIVNRHMAMYELHYYEQKLKRFTLEEIPSGFKNSQLNDTRLITKFALAYLKGVFPSVYPVNGFATDLFKRQWGLLERNEAKDRSYHRHHTIDALTIACINRGKYAALCEAVRNSADGRHLTFAKPWKSFDTDVLTATEYLVPKFYNDDNALRQTKKVIRDTRSGKPILKDGKKQYIQGHTARGSLHKDTFYGCIMTPPEKERKPENIFVERVSVSVLTEKDAEKIIDKRIKKIFIDNLESKIQTIEEIQTQGLLLPYKINGRTTYMKKVRIKAKTTKPLRIKKHPQSENRKDYKNYFYAVNDENYLFVLYRGVSDDGKTVSDYRAVNLLDAVHAVQQKKEMYPAEITKNGTVLKVYKTLKVGKTVILKESEDENIWELPHDAVWKRLYRIAGLAVTGSSIQIKLVHCSCAEPWVYLKGQGSVSEMMKFRCYNTPGSLVCLVEGCDFAILPDGKIIKK